MTLFTVGFTRKSAEQFFETLRNSGVRRVLDVRLNNSSQLAGFSKSGDIEYFLRAIAGIDYRHLPEFAPTQAMLDSYKKAKGSWEEYERRYLALLCQRQGEGSLPRELFDGGCLLCSEPTPEHCHRRVLAEYLQRLWSGIEIVHL